MHYQSTGIDRESFRETVEPLLDSTKKVFQPIRAAVASGESHFAEIVSSAEDAIISKDVNGIVQTWNRAASRIFGYGAHEMVGQSILAVIPSDLHHEETAILQHIRSGERIENYEARRIRKNGEEFVASVTISPIKNQRGEVIGASKIARDITDIRNAEQLRLRNEKLAAVTRVASVVGHQINNPMEALTNLIYLAQQRCTTDPEAVLYLNLAQQEVRRISHIAQQSIGIFHDPSTESRVHVRELLQYVLSIYESRLQGANITVDLDFAATHQVLVRRGEMLQVSSAVVANAIDAMPFGGRLTICSRDLDEPAFQGVEIVVRDTGMGIPKGHQSNLFEPFFTTKGSVGSGMGLWTARQFVEKHGGRISIASSTDPGSAGTAVTIVLPKAH